MTLFLVGLIKRHLTWHWSTQEKSNSNNFYIFLRIRDLPFPNPGISKTQTRLLRIMFENKVMVFWWKKKVPCKRPVCSSRVFFFRLATGGAIFALHLEEMKLWHLVSCPEWEWSRGSILENFIRSQKVWSKKKESSIRWFQYVSMYFCINTLLRVETVCLDLLLFAMKSNYELQNIYRHA